MGCVHGMEPPHRNAFFIRLNANSYVDRSTVAVSEVRVFDRCGTLALALSGCEILANCRRRIDTKRGVGLPVSLRSIPFRATSESAFNSNLGHRDERPSRSPRSPTFCLILKPRIAR